MPTRNSNRYLEAIVNIISIVINHHREYHHQHHHQVFIESTLAHEQEEYLSEGVEWTQVPQA